MVATNAQIAAIVAGLLCLPLGEAAAQEIDVRSTETKLRVYADDDHVTVVSPSVAAQFDATESLGVALATTVDVVSAASVDVVTQASPGTVKEVRVEGSAALTWALSSIMRLRATGIVSHESDYLSFRPGVAGQIEVAQRNATIDLAYTGVLDEAGHALNENFSRTRRGHVAVASFTQILDPRTYVDALIDLRRLKGYHASPYRLVPIGDGITPAVSYLDEETPKLRQSFAARAGLRRALGPSADWFVHASYRLYADNWSIASHTLSAKLLHSLAEDRYLVGLHLRGYTQSAADFYQPYYETPSGSPMPQYRTRDRTLGGMRSVHASLTVDTALTSKSDTWRVRTMAAGTQFFFPDFPPQSRRLAMTLGLSLLTPL